MDTSILQLFHHRQVVINFYDDDELVDRVGFHFDTMTIDTMEVRFIKNDTSIYTLQLNNDMKFVATTEFKNHYRFLQEGTAKRIDLYFP